MTRDRVYKIGDSLQDLERMQKLAALREKLRRGEGSPLVEDFCPERFLKQLAEKDFK